MDSHMLVHWAVQHSSRLLAKLTIKGVFYCFLMLCKLVHLALLACMLQSTTTHMAPLGAPQPAQLPEPGTF